MSKKKRRTPPNTRAKGPASAARARDRVSAGTGKPNVADVVADWSKTQAVTPTATRPARPPVVARSPTADRKPSNGSAESLHTEPNQPSHGGCDALLDEAQPRGLAATYEFEAAGDDEPYTETIAFTGVRVGAGNGDPRDRFEHTSTVKDIPPNSGRVTVTARVQDINDGTWRITARPVHRVGNSGAVTTGVASSRAPHRVLTAATRFAPLAYGPRVRLASWPALVGTGAVVAVAMQGALLARMHANWWAAMIISVVACLIGYLGAKLWYLALHRAHPRTFLTAGACIQGFIVGAVATMLLGAAATGLAIGTLLDATAPGLFFGMAIGRPGCWLTGCCAGRPTGARWGLWSSDRHIVIRRYPVQLVEAAGALVIAVLALVAVLLVEPRWPGAIFVGAVAAYTLGRQFLFPLRSDPHTPRGRHWTAVVCTAILVAVAASLAIS